VQSYDQTEAITELEPLAAKWQSFGFGVVTADGHDVAQLRSALGAWPVVPGRPTAIICRTVKGKGLPFAEGQAAWHYQHGIDAGRAASMRAVLAATGWDRS
jgi:transketolase